MVDLYKATEAEEKLIQDTQRELAQGVQGRVNFNTQFEEIASLIWPEMRNTFYPNSLAVQGAKQTDQQIDATGMMALQRFSAICDSMLSPRGSAWHGLAADDDYVMKDRATRLWFEEATRILFKERYRPLANFGSQNFSVWQSLGAFGNGALFTDELMGHVTGETGLRYAAIPIGEIFFKQNHQGIVDGFLRVMRFTARQVMQRWPDKFPEQMRVALDAKSETLFEFVHRVSPRTDYEPGRLDDKGKVYHSCYICLSFKMVMEEGGYYSFPLAVSRYPRAPGAALGHGPAAMVLPALKTLNAEKKMFLKQGHRAGDPVLLTTEDGVVDFSMRPGFLNKGGVSNDGQRLVHILPTGEIQITIEMMDREGSIINDAFLVSLFQIAMDQRVRTATEVIELANEKGILLAPTVGAQHNDYLGFVIPREMDLLARQGKLPLMPPRLREAEGNYRIEFTSPLSRAMRAQEAAGFMRTLETVTAIVNVTQDPAPLDNFDFDAAIPAIADIQAVPPSWMASAESVAQKREARAKIQAAQTAVQAAPAEAAMVKAEAIAGKSG